MPERLLTLVVAICLVLLATGRASAAPVIDGEFAVDGKPGYMTQGPDGNVWVVLDGSGGDDVAKVSPAGVVEGFDVPALAGAIGIAVGSDGNLWVTRSLKVSKFSPGNPAGAQEFDVADLAGPRDITTGPDGNLWAAVSDTLLKIPPGNPTGYEKFTIAGLDARGMSDDSERLWIASFGNGRIFSATTAGVATPHDVGGNPQEVAAGLGGQVAYSNQGSDPQTVGRLIDAGSPLTTPTPGTDPFGVTFGPDGAYWFAQFLSGNLGRLTTDGQYTVLEGLSAGSGPRHIAAGAGNTLWVSLETARKIARVSGVDPATAIPIFDKRVAIAGLRLAPKWFRVTKGRTSVSARKRGAKRAPAGTTIRFRLLNESATVRFTLEQKLDGRRSGKRCLAPTRKLRSHERCARVVKRGPAIVRKNLRVGARAIRFSGRIGRRTVLKPGGYRLTAVATAADRRRSKPARASFFVVPAR